MDMVIEPAWTNSPRIPLLGGNEVHVWKIDLDDGPDTTTHLLELLSEKERGHARRFHHMRDRSGYVVSHGMMRMLLGGYLHLHPGTIDFAVTAHGKPHLLPLPGRTPISFNLSHSGGLAVIGIASGPEIGIDIEFVERDFPIADTARRVLTETEFDRLASLPNHLRIPEFYRFWTMKEAYLKGVGTGFTREMNSFEVSVLRGKPAHCCGVADLPENGGEWMLFELPPIPGYAGALAVRTEPSAVRCLEVNPDACCGFLRSNPDETLMQRRNPS
jgi:4'-phosphopantetheinyl transferase